MEDLPCPELYGTCQPAMQELKVILSALEKLKTCERQGETMLFFENIWKTLNLVTGRACCCRTNDCLLLLLTVVGKCFLRLGNTAQQGTTCKSFCREDASSAIEGSTMNGLRSSLHRESTIFIVLRSLLHTNKFVSYKASKVFLHYFEQLPHIIADCRESIQPLLTECAKRNSTLYMTLLHDMIKYVRKSLQRSSSEFGSEVNNGIFAQMKLLVTFLKCCNDTCHGKLFGTCEHAVHSTPLCASRVYAMYQAEKLNNYLFLISKKNEFHETAPGFFQSEQLKSLIEHLTIFLGIFSFRWKSIFAEEELDSSLFILYKLKIFLLKTKDYTNANKDVIQQAMEILSHFVNDADAVEHFGSMKLHGFGGKTVALVSGSEPASSKEYSHCTQNLRLLVLVILNSYACLLDGGYSSPFYVLLELGEKALSHLLAILQHASETSHGCSSTAHCEQMTDNFCTILIKVMVDDDDQLCRATQTLLYLYRKTTKLCSIHGIRYPMRKILNEKFPHSLFWNLLQEISFDHIVCIDWLISDETCFASALSCYLDIVIEDFDSFLQSLSRIGMSPKDDQHSNRKGAELSNYRRGTSNGENRKFSRPDDETHPVSDKQLLNSLRNDHKDDAIILGENNSRADVTVVVAKLASKAFISLVDYSSSESGDDSSNEFNNSNAAESCFAGNVGSDTKENYDSLAKVVGVDCEMESCPGEGTKDWMRRVDIAGLDSGCCEDDTTRQETREDWVENQTLTGDHRNLNEDAEDNIEDKTIEIFMDFLIRLRLKLERIEGNFLSTRDFKGLISQLGIIEDSYDSFALEVTNQLGV